MFLMPVWLEVLLKKLCNSFLLLTNFQSYSCLSRFLSYIIMTTETSPSPFVDLYSLSRFIINGCSCSLVFFSPFRSAHFITSAFLSSSFSTLVLFVMSMFLRCFLFLKTKWMYLIIPCSAHKHVHWRTLVLDLYCNGIRCQYILKERKTAMIINILNSPHVCNNWRRLKDFYH